MKKVLGVLGLAALIGGGYYVAAQFTKNQDFERKTISLMKQQGAKVLEAFANVPGCNGRFRADSASFRQDGFWGQTGEGRLFFLSESGSAFDVSYKSEIVEDGRRIFVSPQSVSELQARLAGMILSGCR